MDREITVSYSDDILRFTVWKFWIRSIGVGGFIGFAVICVAFLYLFLSGNRSWFVGFLGAMVCVSFGIGVVSYFIYLNRSLEKFRRMDTPSAKFRFSDDRIGIESDIGWTELSWKMIEKIWKYPSVWLVFIVKQGYFTLPTAEIDDELKEFISQKVKENGGVAN
jgi:hypothetical protein